MADITAKVLQAYSYRDVQALYRDTFEASPVGKRRDYLEEKILAELSKPPEIEQKADKRRQGIAVFTQGIEFPSKAAAIRYLHVDLGWTASEIKNELGIRFQHVNNVITQIDTIKFD